MLNNLTIKKYIILFLLISALSCISLADSTLHITGIIEPVHGPVANFTGFPLSGSAPLIVRFTDQSTGMVTSWAWDFENDGRVDSRLRNPLTVYRNPGTYSVRLTVSGPDGSSERVREDYITVTGPLRPPVARFSQSLRFGVAPLTVRFTDTSLGNPTSYLWTFGDGTTSTAVNPVHTYTYPGFYRVSLQVNNDGGTSNAGGVVAVLRPWFRPF